MDTMGLRFSEDEIKKILDILPSPKYVTGELPIQKEVGQVLTDKLKKQGIEAEINPALRYSIKNPARAEVFELYKKDSDSIP